MALRLIQNKGVFRPYWYGTYRGSDGRVKTSPLGVRVRGTPPPNFHDSPEIVGDKEFERSRATARTALEKLMNRAADFKAEARAAESTRGDAIRETQKLVELRTGKAFEDTPLADLGAKHEKNRGARSHGYLSFVRTQFKNLADFAANWQPEPAETVLGVTRELATAFVKDIAARYSWESTKKVCHIMRGAFADALPVGVENPFQGVRKLILAEMTTGEDGERVRVEKNIHHVPLDRPQVRRVWATAERLHDRTLHDIAVTSACTGLRIGDACLLKWESVDLRANLVHLATQKTGARVALPIFAYNPAAADYEPELGEFRRVLEGRLAERSEGDRYVYPEASELYLRRTKNENGETLNTGRNVIYSRGKALFARALFAEEDTVEDIDPDTPERTPEDVVALIDAANWTEERKARTKDIYTRYTAGESYRDIQAATGFSKSTISYDLGAVERLAAVKIKATKKHSVRDLLDKTRQERAVGARAASLYSWHSLRAAFVVMAMDNGISLDTVRELVGHTETEMTLQYYHPTERMAAETARRTLARRNARQTPPHALAGNAPALLGTGTTDAAEPDLAALARALASLTDEQRQALAMLTQGGAK